MLDAEAPTPAERTWPVVVKLKHPIDYAGETIESLTFRRGSLGALKGLKLDSTPTVEQLIEIAGRLCGQPRKAIEMIDSDDSGEVIELALDFFARCLGAGRTS